MSEDKEYLRAMEAQRRAFEAQFGSLEDMGFEDKTKVAESDSDDNEDDNDSDNDETSETESFDSDEEGLVYGKPDAENLSSDEESEEDDDDDNENNERNQPIVVKFVDTTSTDYKPISKDEQKMLKSGKAYKKRVIVETKSRKKQSATQPDSEENIKNDLELNRFLKESHILSNFDSESSGADLTLRTMDGGTDGIIGKARRYTQNSRLKDISSINGHDSKINKLENVPMSIRKGMLKSYQNKISKFEKDAKEGGIVLSKVKKGEFRKIDGHLTIMERIGKGVKSKQKDTYRKKGLKINSVGRNTRNGLVISQKEIDKVNGVKFDAGKGKKRGRRR